MSVWLIATHLIALAVGVLSGVWVTHRRLYRTAIIHEEDLMIEDTEPHKPLRERIPHPFRDHGPTRGALALFLILGGAMTLAFAVQQSAYQNEASDRDQQTEDQAACTEAWGKDVIDTLRARFGATQKLERADARRDNALDAIILTVAAFQKHPPTATEEDFRMVITEFVAAKVHRDKVRRQVRAARAENPYPRLQCDDQGAQDDRPPP